MFFSSVNQGLFGWFTHPHSCLVSSIFLFSIYAHLFYQFNETFAHTRTCRWKIFWDTKRLQLVREEKGTGQSAGSQSECLCLESKYFLTSGSQMSYICQGTGIWFWIEIGGLRRSQNAKCSSQLLLDMHTHTLAVGEVVKKKMTPPQEMEKSLTLEREYNWQLLADSWQGRCGGCGSAEVTERIPWQFCSAANLLNE